MKTDRGVRLSVPAFWPVRPNSKYPLPTYSVEKLGIRMKVMVATSHLARGDLLDVPSSVQMMGFGG